MHLLLQGAVRTVDRPGHARQFQLPALSGPGLAEHRIAE